MDEKDSISIESQIEFCKYELKGGNCKEYTDKGNSGKNTDRPKFQELVRDIKRGFKMGGKAPYGFHTEPIKMDGINTKKLVVNPEETANIRLMFEMYADPKTSYGDITRYFAEQGILFYGKELIRPTLAQMLRNPVYVQADLTCTSFSKVRGRYLSMTPPTSQA